MAWYQWFLLCLTLSLLHDQSLAFTVRIAKRVVDPNDAGFMTIPLTIESNTRRYTTVVDMSNGTSQQSFRFGLTTSTGYTMVAGSSCDACTSVPTYNQTKSVTAQNWTEAPSTGNGATNPFSSPLIKEVCSVQQSNGTIWGYANQTIVVANQSTSIFTNGVSGLFSLGTNSHAGTYSDSIIGYLLSSNPKMASLVIGMAINSGVNSDDGGALHLLMPDPDSFVGNVAWKTVQGSAPDVGTNTTFQPTSQPAVTGEWLVQLDGWSFKSGADTISNVQGGMSSVDPYFQGIYVPFAQAAQIYAGVNNAILQGSSDTPGTQRWAIPCDSKMSFTVSFNPASFSIDESILVSRQGAACYGIIEGWADTTNPNYLLGSQFLSTVYTIFNASSPYTSTSSSLGFAQRAPVQGASKGTNVGAIVGGSVGGAAFLVMVAGLGLFTYRYYKTRNKNANTQPDNKANPDSFEKRPSSGVIISGGDEYITTSQQQRKLQYRDSTHRDSMYSQDTYTKGNLSPNSTRSGPLPQQPVSPSTSSDRLRSSTHGNLGPEYKVEPFVPNTASGDSAQALYPVGMRRQSAT
ncbi:hypothetical protein JAAARDRAFT_44624 [Jaapia argillacea MUCL 33604]|uniref:Peptidase A1 domain-containing protein n=1 Tax=Jaapia argillacea MUCL 33604 TaxID=933084 RepID=A0A067Q4Y6_9AGAM|nr:hypothetical protein JAAARDRAFT_44624 [Jaapia argillacea MUCL 33604]